MNGVLVGYDRKMQNETNSLGQEKNGLTSSFEVPGCVHVLAQTIWPSIIGS